MESNDSREPDTALGPVIIANEVALYGKASYRADLVGETSPGRAVVLITRLLALMETGFGSNA